MADEITLTIDGRQISVPKGTLVLEAAKKLGITIPVFCYHEKLAPVGACRQCLVNIEGMPKPQVSCSTQVAEGMVVHTDTPEVREMWRSVVEFLLINHPLDCPVCDRGGECPLQDNTFNYGPTDSRFEHEKRHYEKPVPLSSLVLLDRERCIQCFRCVRFQKEIADEPQIQMFSRGGGDYIDIFPGKPFESQFSGNTIELCPVGALLSSAFRFRARPWELKKTESICQNCGVGCNINIDARNSRFVVRYLSRENPEVDDGWLCDRGRFDSAVIHSPERITSPLVRKNGELVEATWEEAVTAALDGMKRAGASAAGGLGSAARTNEENYLFQKFLRLVVGTNNIDYTIEPRPAGGTDAVAAMCTSGLFDGSIRDIDVSDVILTIGSDITNELPVLDLRIQKAVRQRGAKLITAYPLHAPLVRHSTAFLAYSYGHEADLAIALAGAVGEKLPGDAAGVNATVFKTVESIIRDAKLVSILVSRDFLESSERGCDTLGAIGIMVDAIKGRGAEARVMMLSPGANVQGASEVGLLPGYFPGFAEISSDNAAMLREIWGTAPPVDAGLSGWEMIQSPSINALWIMGQDPARDLVRGSEVRSALQKLETLVVQDCVMTDTSKMATVVLPSSSFAENKGTVTNIERRLQRILPAIKRVEDSKSDVDIIEMAAFLAGAPAFNFGRIEAVFEEMARAVPAYRGVTFDSIGPRGRQWEVRG